jgi:hypothetical protein
VHSDNRPGTWSILRLVMVLTPLAIVGALYLRGSGPSSAPIEKVRAVPVSPTVDSGATRGPRLAPASDPELAEAAAQMVAPPQGTPNALLGTDPRRLRALMHRGFAVYQRAPTQIQQVEGIRLIQIAAVLGHGPSRDLLAREYSRSRLVRSVVPAADAIRYALDVFTGDLAAAKNTTYAFRMLVVYYSEEKALNLLATNIVEAIGDDSRLQVVKRLDPLFDSLVPIAGACASVARVVNVQRNPGQDCPSPLRHAVVNYARVAPPVGRDPSSRRHALAQVEQLDTSN